MPSPPVPKNTMVVVPAGKLIALPIDWVNAAASVWVTGIGYTVRFWLE